jgi:hypothetical protein
MIPIRQLCENVGNSRKVARRPWSILLIDERVDSTCYQLKSLCTGRLILVCVVYDNVWLRPRSAH